MATAARDQIRDFAELVDAAATDAGGGGASPQLYQVTSRSLASDAGPLRKQLTDAAIEYVNGSLRSVTSAHQATFLQFLSRSELASESPRLREALFDFVDGGVRQLTSVEADVAVFLLRRAWGRDRARTWLPVVRQQLHDSPSWQAVDILAELPGFMSNAEYSVDDFLADLSQLEDSADYEFNVDARRHKWARLRLPVTEVTSAPDFLTGPQASAWLDSFLGVQQGIPLGVAA